MNKTINKLQLQSGKSLFDINFTKPFSFFNIFKAPSFCCTYKPIESDLIINLDELEDIEKTKVYEREIKDSLFDSFNDLVINIDSNVLTDI